MSTFFSKCVKCGCIYEHEKTYWNEKCFNCQESERIEKMQEQLRRLKRRIDD